MRLCSRKRPTMLRTRMRSLMPRMPGFSEQMPRTIRSTCTPACEARYNSCTTFLSSSEFTLAMMRAGLPARAWSASRAIRFAIALGQVDRRHQQRVVVRLLGVGGQKIEHVVHRKRHLRIRRQQAQIGVEGRRGRVVVAGAQMGIAAHRAVGILARDQGQLAVRLQPHQPVEDLHSRIFQFARPLDVGGFIETRLHLHDHGYFLASPPPAPAPPRWASYRWCGRASA